MILTALSQYYDRLLQDKNVEIPAYGFSEQRISYALVLSEQGELVDVAPHLTEEKKPKGKFMPVPQPAKRTSGIKPNFLWDKTAYVLGLALPKEKNSKTPFALSLATFKAFRELHLNLLQNVQDKALKALALFLQAWQPEDIASSPHKQKILEALDSNVVFQLDGLRQYVHETTEAQAIWSKLLTPEDAQTGNCLITGEAAPIARLHPAIKGVAGGQTAGVSIVSFNKASFESFGKTQGNNAPVSDQEAFAYTTALNYLLRRDNKQVVSLGDASLVFWALTEQTEQAQQAEAFVLNFFNPSSATTDEGETVKIRDELDKIAQGRPLEEIAPAIDPHTQFFILGLAPNASRLSIRFWLQTEFGEIKRRLRQHFQDLELEPLPWQTPPSIWRLLLQLAPHREGQKNKIEDAPPHLAGEFMRAILTGERYPRAVLAQLLARFRADGDISGLRVAMVKAILQRDFRKSNKNNKEKIPMGLDEKNTNPAYLLGRLFAVLENIQREALKEINATIKDKYYASAATMPRYVFQQLLVLSNHHLTKIRKDKPGLAFVLEKQSGSIISLLPTEFPLHFAIEDQGRFSIGYYQQKWQPKKDKNEEATTKAKGTENPTT